MNLVLKDVSYNELEKLNNYYSQKKNKGAMYITPHGTALVNTKGGLYPVDRHGNISKKVKSQTKITSSLLG